MPHLSGPRRYFFHHSYRVLSLQNCPPLAGKTGGTRIEKYRSLIMPLVRKCKEQHALAHFVQPSCSALICSRRCGSCSVFEVAHTVYKCATNECRCFFCAILYINIAIYYPIFQNRLTKDARFGKLDVEPLESGF